MTTTLPERQLTDTAAAAPRTPAAIECLCPFCGAFNTDVGRPCRHCRTEDTTAARAAARKRVGPWFVLQAKNPAAPGLSLQALLAMIRQGTVTDRSVIRGPATGQLWRLAGKVRGISREFGACYGCGGDLYAADPTCPHCQRPQSLPADIDTAAAEVAPPPPAKPDRPLPRQDLLTARDVAKAFSLGYTTSAGGAPPVSLDELLTPTGITPRPRPTALAAATAAVAVALVGWIVVHSLTHTPAPADAELPRHAIVALAPLHPVPWHEVRTTTPPAPVMIPVAVTPDAVIPAPAALAVALPPPLVLDVPAVHAPPAHPATVDEPVALTAAANEPTPADTDDPKRLMAAGLSAEARGDYAVAVQQYERIQSLSSDEWPAGLSDRLSVARAAVRSGDKD